MAIKYTRVTHLRWRFLVALCRLVSIVWPVLSGLIAVQWLIGMIVGRVEGWSIGEATYFTFVTGLTIGYGDLVPRQAVSRALAVVIGIIGTLVVALFAAIGVRALQSAAGDGPGQPPQ